jgi:hypothetical protein
MPDRRVADSKLARNVWLGVAAAAVIGVLWGGLALHEAAGRNASVAQGPSGAGGASDENKGRQVLTTETTPHATAAMRPPMDLTPTPAVETATFALG